MFKLNTNGLIAICLALLLVPNLSDARRKKKAKKQGPKLADIVTKAKTTYEELAGNSNPDVRRAVYEGKLALDKKERKNALAMGIEEKDWAILGPALREALRGRDKTLKKKAQAIVAKLLESGDPEQRKQGVHTIRAAYKKKGQIKALRAAAKTGTKEARAAARALLIEEGGPVAWSVISAGLAEADGEPERAQAMKAFETFDHVVAYSWALKRLHGIDEFADLARDYLVRVKSRKLGKSLEKKLLKDYRKLKNSDADGAFQARLRLAYVLSQRGYVNIVKDTLLAAFNPNYRPPPGFTGFKVMAWKGLQNLRDGDVLGKQLSARYRLNMRDLFLNNDSAEEVDAAYTWLENWVRANADPKVIKLLQDATKSERPVIRTRAMGALANIKHRPSVVIFEKAIKEGRVDIRLAAAKGLAAVAKRGDEDRLNSYLRFPNMGSDVKYELVKGLANIGTDRAANLLQMQMYDRDKRIKIAVAEALAKNGGSKTVKALTTMKRSPDLDVRFAVWKGLLIKPTKLTIKEFKDGAVLWLTVEHLRTLGADKRFPVELISYVAEKGASHQRKVAVELLEERGDVSATRLLTIYEASTSEDTAAQALNALARLRGKSSVATYRKAITHRFGSVRAAGYTAIREYGPKALLETVVEGMEDQEPIVRANAARAAVYLARKRR